VKKYWSHFDAVLLGDVSLLVLYVS